MKWLVCFVPSTSTPHSATCLRVYNNLDSCHNNMKANLKLQCFIAMTYSHERSALSACTVNCFKVLTYEYLENNMNNLRYHTH